MHETAAILSAYLCFALLHGAAPERLPSRLASTVNSFDAWRIGARLAALLFFALSVWLWSLTGSGAAVWIGPIAAWMVAGVSIVLLRPRFARLVWATAAACPPLIVVLSLVGGWYAG